MLKGKGQRLQGVRSDNVGKEIPVTNRVLQTLLPTDWQTQSNKRVMSPETTLAPTRHWLQYLSGHAKSIPGREHSNKVPFVLSVVSLRKF